MSLLLGTPIYSDANATYTPTLSGGSWVAGLPLTNLQDRKLAKVARSTNAAITSTKFDIDLLTARQVRILALVGHNISTVGKVRVRGFSLLPIFDVYDFAAGWTDVGTPTRVAAGFACSDGVTLDAIGDDSGATSEIKNRVIAFTGNGTKVIRFRVSRISAYADHRIEIADTTAPATRLSLKVNYASATPAFSIVGGVGTIASTLDRGDGSYEVVCTAPGVVAANTNRLDIYPAAGANADTASLYIGDFMAFDAVTDQLVYDAGLKDAWPTVFPTGSVPSYHPSYSTRKFTAEDAVGVALPFVVVPAAPYSARYWRWEVLDTTNAAGYVQLGRLVMAYGESPTIAPRPGLKLGWDTNSTRTDTDSYAAVYNAKGIRRTVMFAIDDLSADEAFVRPFDIQRRLGITGQLFFVYDDADVELLPRRAFLAVQRELSPMESVVFSRFGVPFSLVEELA